VQEEDGVTSFRRCPRCGGGFVEEAASSGGEGGATALTQAVRWLAREESDDLISSTEIRIARLLDDLHDHLAMVEGLRSVSAQMRATWGADLEDAASQQPSPRLCPAPPEVLEHVKTVVLVDNDSSSVSVSATTQISKQALKQTPQCVVCCADFEAGEELSQLPGCGHLFHDSCISEWLHRAANCPICRCSLCEAVDCETRSSQEGASSERMSFSVTTPTGRDASARSTPHRTEAQHHSPSEEVTALETLPLPVGWSRLSQSSGGDEVVNSPIDVASGAVHGLQPSSIGSRTSLVAAPSTASGVTSLSRSGTSNPTSNRASTQQHSASAAATRPASSAVLMGAASSLLAPSDENHPRGTATGLSSRHPGRTSGGGQSGQRSSGLIPASGSQARTSVL